ncbi:MAG: YggT family protein [Candidatus Gastranaerophilales bacterium]|jgi:YggT family protein|nr:YggT family protein [Candidatus Gastranaerophilales bacterium]
MGISIAVARIFDLIFLLLIIYCLLTWFPNIKWYSQPFSGLKSFAEIFFSPFRKFIPPVGMLDISAIVAFICLQILRAMILSLLSVLGL